ncbi:MAG: PHP domain-containing protein [Candidatus Spechtbacterales bacterium]|nr:PHP domain-containing protein [Candidatus Spechtbacterales bacterium]
MKLKANLHFHTKEDINDIVDYTLREGIDHASKLGFDVLAVTCHRHNAWTEEHAEYAKEKGILLIPGAEINVDEDPSKLGRHTVILNSGADSAMIETFEQLAKYKEKHPEVFVIAVHPYFYGNFSLKEYLEKYIDLYDAIEHSWFYSKMFNRNKKAVEMAKKYNKPLIATSDTHYLYEDGRHMNRNYAIIDAEEKTIPAIFNAIREGNFINVTKPSNFWRDMFWGQLRHYTETFWDKRGVKKAYLKEKRERHLKQKDKE